MAKMDFKCTKCGYIFEADVKYTFKMCPVCQERAKKHWQTVRQGHVIKGENSASTRRNMV